MPCVYCVLCGNRKNSVSYHAFPKQEENRKKWLTFCRIEENVLNTVTKLCSNHFRDEDLIWKAKGANVKPNVVPLFQTKKRKMLAQADSTVNEANAAKIKCIVTQNLNANNNISVKMENADDNMEAAPEILPDIKNTDVKTGTDVFVVEITNIKTEIKEEVLENEEPGSPQNESFDYMKYEEPSSSEAVYCETCGTYCKDTDSCKEHLELNPGCKKLNGDNTVDEDIVDYNLQEDSFSNHMPQQPGEPGDTDHLDHGSSGEPLKETPCIKSDLAKKYDTGIISQQSSTAEKSNQKLEVERPFPCDLCNKSFIRKDALFSHKLIHSGERPFSCNVCNKTFTQRGSLNTHKLIHSGERQYACDVCNQSFILKGTLNSHKLIHSGERPFSCNECSQSFTQRGDLNRHKRIHSSERPFSCNLCNQTFILKGALNTHKLVHTGERPFSCEVCNKTFSRKGTLNTHRLSHTGEKPFSCDLCNETFSLKGNLNTHKLIHTGERPFLCDVCNETFTRKSHLNKHKLTSAHTKQETIKKYS